MGWNQQRVLWRGIRAQVTNRRRTGRKTLRERLCITHITGE